MEFLAFGLLRVGCVIPIQQKRGARVSYQEEHDSPAAEDIDTNAVPKKSSSRIVYWKV